MDDLISRSDVLDKAIFIPIAKIMTKDKIIYRKAVFVDDIEKIPSAQQWIPCSERLPERQTSVLVTDYDAVEMAYINGDGKWMDYFGDKLKAVTAWMPLPEPWRGDIDGTV